MLKYILIIYVALCALVAVIPAYANPPLIVCKTFQGTEFVYQGRRCPSGSYFVRYA